MNRAVNVVCLLVVCLLATQSEWPAAAPEPAALLVKNERGKATKLSAADLTRLRRHKAKVTGHNGSATYEGASLADVLLAAKVTLGKNLKGSLLRNCLVAEAADGYLVIFSLAEVDPAMTDKVVLVADRKDGKPLDDKEGPFRLIVLHDKLGVRRVKQLTSLSIRQVAGAAEQPVPERRNGRPNCKD